MRSDPEQHHEDCDYRNSSAAKQTAGVFGVDVEEHAEVFDCNLGCMDGTDGDPLPDLLAASVAALDAIIDTPALDGADEWNPIIDALNAAILRAKG